MRGGRKGPVGVPGRTPGTFRRGRSPVEKPGRPSRTGRLYRPATRRGCPFFGLLFFGQAKKSDSAFGRRAKRPPRRRPDRGNATTKRYRYWTPACAGVTAKDKTARRAPNHLPKGRGKKQKALQAPLTSSHAPSHPQPTASQQYHHPATHHPTPAPTAHSPAADSSAATTTQDAR